MCTVLMPLGGKTIAVNKYIISYVILPGSSSDLSQHVSLSWTIFVAPKVTAFCSVDI